MIKISQLINDNYNAATNQFIIEVARGYVFQSYDSVIAFADKKENKVYITKKWEYSKTTRKHLYIFLRKYCGAYYDTHKREVLREIKRGKYELVKELDLEHLINL